MRQPSLAHVLQPKWRTALQRLREERSGGTGKIAILTVVALGFWAAVFGVLYRVLKYFRGVEELGRCSPASCSASCCCPSSRSSSCRT